MANQFHSLLVDMDALCSMPVERIQETKNAAEDVELSILLAIGTIGRLSAFAVNGGGYDAEDALEDMKSISAMLEPLTGVLMALAGVRENASYHLTYSEDSQDLEVNHA